MKKNNLIDFNNVINWVSSECKERGLNMRDVIKHAKLAKSTPENWTTKNPKQFEALARIKKSMDELQAANQAYQKVLNK